MISLYRQQLKLLSHKLSNHTGVEMLTADRSQGRDKDCIMISLVRSNDNGQVGNDPQLRSSDTTDDTLLRLAIY